jgi:hypothetical protein
MILDKKCWLILMNHMRNKNKLNILQNKHEEILQSFNHINIIYFI